MLEDDFTYVIRKAFKGLALSPGEAALRAGLPEPEVLSFSRGKFSAHIAHELAPVLGLDPGALATHDSYQPTPLEMPEIHRLDLPFGGEQVNAWLIRTGDISILFDTGNDRDSCMDALKEMGVSAPAQIFITHGHSDHVGGLATFSKEQIPIYGSEIRGALPLRPGDEVRCGPLSIRACDLSGHFTPSFGYHVGGLSKPILVTGDALFAGSMGGCENPKLYQHALARLREVLAPLADETIQLPGHGPASTLGEERERNPFL